MKNKRDFKKSQGNHRFDINNVHLNDQHILEVTKLCGFMTNFQLIGKLNLTSM